VTVRAFQVPALVAALVAPGSAFSQVPVIDSATLTQATQTAQNTAQIMNTNQQILTTVNQTLSAVTGTRTTSTLSSLGIGSGFSMSSVPGLSSLLGGGGMSMAGLGQYGSLASSIINSLNLVKTLTGASSATMPTDQAWTGAVNTVAAITAAIAGSQAASTARTTAFQGAAGQVGSAQDIKASIDQNSQFANSNRPHDQRTHWLREPDQCCAQRTATAGSGGASESLTHVQFRPVVRDARRELSERKTSYV
jgi:Type IV secretion system proteins